MYTQGIQLFDGCGAGLFTQPVLRFQPLRGPAFTATILFVMIISPL